MALDVGPTYARANELRLQASSLRDIKKRLESYKNVLSLNWQGTEVTYYIIAINRACTNLSNTANSMDSLANSLVSTANTIRQEDLAAEEAARREAERRERERLEAEAAELERQKAASKSKSKK